MEKIFPISIFLATHHVAACKCEKSFQGADEMRSDFYSLTFIYFFRKNYFSQPLLSAHLNHPRSKRACEREKKNHDEE